MKGRYCNIYRKNVIRVIWYIGFKFVGNYVDNFKRRECL